MNIIGISCFYHDSAACLVQDGKIIAAAQEERFTRKKHDRNFPKNAINYCLREGGITVNDIDYAGFYEKPFLKFERILFTYLAYSPWGVRSFIKAMPMWIKQRIWMSDFIRKELNFKGKIIFPEHHESHAASSFFPSPFQDAAILTMDAVGEWTTSSFGVGDGNTIELWAEQKFPHSLGLLYSAFTYYMGFKVNSSEYKVMGLAPYGEAKYVDVILNKLIDLKEDGSFKLNMKYFNYTVGQTMTNWRFHKLFGGLPRRRETRLTKKQMDLAKSIQVVTEEIMLKMARHVHKKTGKKNLCLAGGVALNCVGNGRILKEGPFEKIWIQPAAGDAGCALGVALFIWHQYLGNERKADGIKDFQKSSLLGPSFSNGEIETFLKKNSIVYTKMDEEMLLDTVSSLIGQEKVIGWFEGRMEFGPRALGARSIIGDARSKTMQKDLNLKTKFRESFRPFAPTILQEKASEYFELKQESPYMLLVSPVKKEKRINMNDEQQGLFGMDKLNVARSEIPAVTHVDYSARVQTIKEEENPLYYSLIKRFYEKTGCPAIINTSFNVRGEPIVCKLEEAYKCFMRTNMDYLVLGNFLLDKQNQKISGNGDNWKKKFELD
ncbi:MAG: carbamoyltransferase [Candidatus Omnitrophica bacterium]|nr:carbamoyltransferase [Candidatus Omnitrophota bacterium]